MANFNELSQHYIKEIEYYLALSQTLLQKGNEGGNLTGSLKTGGDYLETLVKSILKRFLPSRFRVVSGYIATPELIKDNADLPQFDVVIVDNKIPPLMTMKDTDIEINPIEGVCGIIEVKRTLNKKSFTDALMQIQKVVDHGLIKSHIQESCLTVYGKDVGRNPNPLFGIIGIQKDSSFSLCSESEESKFIQLIEDQDSLIDFIWTFDDGCMYPVFQKKNYKDGDNLILGYKPFARSKPVTKSEFSIGDDDYVGRFWLDKVMEEDDKVKVFRKAIGFIMLFMSSTSARDRNDKKIFNYYF